MRDPTTSTVLYKILTPQEKADMPATNWAGTALDVSIILTLQTSHDVADSVRSCRD